MKAELEAGDGGVNRRDQPTTFDRVLETRTMTLAVLLPKAVIEVTTTRKTRAQMMPYSIAVAPRSSRRKRLR